MPILSHQEAFVKYKWNKRLNITGELPPSHTQQLPRHVYHILEENGAHKPTFTEEIN